jgi:hypothetical protein
VKEPGLKGARLQKRVSNIYKVRRAVHSFLFPSMGLTRLWQSSTHNEQKQKKERLEEEAKKHAGDEDE